MGRSAFPTAALQLTLLLALPVASQGQALAVAGGDHSRVKLPAAGVFESYSNAGYRLRVEGNAASVDVSLLPLRSRDPFSLPAEVGEADPVTAVARAVATGSRDRYEAVSRILDWVSRNVSYELDRSAPQEAGAVLERRRGYCTGIARLTVALLAAAGIPAREVPGFLVAAPDTFLPGGARGAGIPSGYHRWVEVRYEDVGWVFSDPLLTHHYVPATYLRLASEQLPPVSERTPGRLLERRDERQPIDVVGEASARVTVRRNQARQRQGALTVVAFPGASSAVLEGGGKRRVVKLAGGTGTFVGLEPGVYMLRVEAVGESPRLARVTLRDRVWASIRLAPRA